MGRISRDMKSPMPENKNLTLGASIATVFLCVLFGVNIVAIKFSLEGFGPFTVAALRFCIASVVISLWAKTTGRPFKLKKGQLHQLVLISIFFLFQVSLFYLGFQKTNASRGSLLSNLQPFLVLFLAHFFVPGDLITPRKLIGISLGFAGAATMFIHNEGVTDDVRTGDILVFIAVVIWGCNAVYIKRIVADYSAFQITLYPTMFITPLLFAAAFIWDSPMIGDLDSKVIGALLYQSLVSASLGFVAWTTLQQKYGVVALHSYVFIIPIVGVALGGTILDEPVASMSILLALALIVTGILVVQESKKN